MTLDHDDFVIFQKMYNEYNGLNVIVSGKDLGKATKLYNKLRQEDVVLRGIGKEQIPLAEKYKEYIRDADRLSNDQAFDKYGTTIDELRNRVSDFKDGLKDGTAKEPNIPRPN